ncbi:unnamed protein product [Mytilus coruscus]|uniref:YqaJ viral recombinase domain-containing protein n=1 Tax=Mytilus coruscus TaxID=42192 RepID=A0A6J8F4J4_MYTCO|nr:unnamed protein product [Mytilus coruscus]
MNAVKSKWLQESNTKTIYRNGRKADTEPDNLIKYLLEYTPSFTNAAISWGRDHEQIAIDSYLIRVRESHPPLTATQNGVIINEHLPHLGATPDGLLYCPHCKPYNGVIEVKCPYALRNLHPLEAARQSNLFVKWIVWAVLDLNVVIRITTKCGDN